MDSKFTKLKGAVIDGRTIFTGGSDCLLRIHDTNKPDDEPGFHDEHTDGITSLSCSVS